MNILRKIKRILFGSSFHRDMIEMKYDTKNKKFPLHLKIKGYILDFCAEQFSNFIIIPCETLHRMIYWGWKLRYNYEFECQNTYYMIHLKLKGMIDYSRKHAHLCWNSDYEGHEMRRLRVACELAKRLYEDDYDTNMNIFNKKWGEPDFLWHDRPDGITCELEIKRKNVITQKDKEQNSKEFKIAHDADELQKSNERKYLYKLMEKYLEGWWD